MVIATPEVKEFHRGTAEKRQQLAQAAVMKTRDKDSKEQALKAAIEANKKQLTTETQEAEVSASTAFKEAEDAEREANEAKDNIIVLQGDYIILACDGVWDAKSSEAGARFLKQNAFDQFAQAEKNHDDKQKRLNKAQKAYAEIKDRIEGNVKEEEKKGAGDEEPEVEARQKVGNAQAWLEEKEKERDEAERQFEEFGDLEKKLQEEMTNGLRILFDDCIAQDLNAPADSKDMKSTDNMTCVLVQFIPDPKPKNEENAQ